MSENKTVSVRKVDMSLWRQFRQRTFNEGTTITAQLQSLIRDWLRVRRETRRDR